MRRARSRGEWWQLLDPSAERPEVELVMERLLDLARDEPELDGPIDIDAPAVERFLSRHRVWTLIPPELVDRSSRARLRDLHLEIAAVQVRIRIVAIRVLELLAAAGIETRVLKGLATSELDYPRPELRQTGDIDLAVGPDQLDDAVRVLVEDGCVDHPNRFDPVLLYGWTLDAPHGVEIDLHTRFFRRSPLGADLLDAPGVALESIPGDAMPAEQRLVHAAGHFMISPPGRRRMNGFLDIGRLLRRDDLDLAAAQAFAQLLTVESLVGAGIRVEAELSGRSDVLAALDRWEQPDWLERRTRLVARRRLVLDHLGRYREVPRGHRLDYLPSWLLPDARQWTVLRRSATDATERAATRIRRSLKR